MTLRPSSNVRTVGSVAKRAGRTICVNAGWTVFDPVNDDTDIFLANPAFNAERPNVLIILDNTANWNTPFTAEKTALINVVNSLDSNFNVGVMMFTETGSGNTGNDGAYVRFAVRQMTDANKTTRPPERDQPNQPVRLLLTTSPFLIITMRWAMAR